MVAAAALPLPSRSRTSSSASASASSTAHNSVPTTPVHFPSSSSSSSAQPNTPVWSLPVALPPVSTLSCPDHLDASGQCTAWPHPATATPLSSSSDGLNIVFSQYEGGNNNYCGSSIGGDKNYCGSSSTGGVAPSTGKENLAPPSTGTDSSGGGRGRASSSLSSCTSTTSVSSSFTDGGWTPFPSPLTTVHCNVATTPATAGEGYATATTLLLPPTHDFPSTPSSSTSSWRAPLQAINHELEQKEGQNINSLLQQTTPNESKYTANSLVKFASSQNWDQQSENLKFIDWNALHSMANNAPANAAYLANGAVGVHPSSSASASNASTPLLSNPQSSPSLSKISEGDMQEIKKDTANGVSTLAAPGVTSSSSLDLEATQKEVERVLKDYLGSFKVQVVGEDDLRFLPVLDAEGCPKCLRGVDDNVGPKVILRCQQQRCNHVMHLSCVMKPCPADNPEAPEGASSWQEATLKKFHCSSYFFNRELKRDDTDLHPMQQDLPGSRRNCLMALEISHLLSNATALRVNWEDALSSLMDPKTGKEYLLLSLDKLQPENGQPQAPPVFRAQRGRVVFKCTDLARNAVWHHDCNYDISKQVGGDLAKLVFTDRDSQNTLTLGVQKRRVPRDGAIDPTGESLGANNTADADLVDAITLLYVKYEFCPQSQQVMGSPMFGPLLLNVPYGQQQQQQQQQQQGASPMMNPAAASAAQMPSGGQLMSTNGQHQPGRPGQPGQVSPMASPMQAAPMMTPNGHLVFPVPLSPPPLSGTHANLFSPLLSPLMSRPGGPQSNRKLSYPGGPLLPPGATLPAGFDPLTFDPSNRGGGMLPLLPVAGNNNANSAQNANGEGVDANRSAMQAQRQLYFDNDQRLNLMTLTQAQQSAVALLATNPNSAANSVNNTPRGSFMGALPGTPLLPSGLMTFPPPSPIMPNGTFPPSHGHGGGGHGHGNERQYMQQQQQFGAPGGFNDGRPDGGANGGGKMMQTGPPSNGGGGNIAGLMQVPMSPDFGAPPRFNMRQHQQQQQQGGGANGGGPNGVASWNPRNQFAGASNSLLGPAAAAGGSGPASNNNMDGLAAQFNGMSLSNGAQGGGGQQFDSYGQRSTGPTRPGSTSVGGGGPNPNGGANGASRPGSAGANVGGAGGANGNGPSNAVPMNTSIDHVIGRVYHLSKTQSGSRFVQEKLSDPQYFPIFFNELKTRVADLMMDCFGHYAIEALLGMCDREQLLILLVNLSGRITEVACHKQGSFSIQFMMDCLTTQTQIGLLADALYPDVDEVMLNCSGHYVILRFLQRYSYPYTKFIHKAIVEHTVKLATDHYGLRVLKSAVDAGPAAQMQEVFSALIKCTNTLVENQYGNYIVQHLLEVAPKPVGIQLKQKMNGKYVRFSKQKFSSNVVEKCLRNSNREWKYTIIRQLISAAGELISDKYGNYCLQTALSVSDRQLVHEFTQAVYPHLNSLRENIKAKWRKILENAHGKHNMSGAGGGGGGGAPGGGPDPMGSSMAGLVGGGGGDAPFMHR